jgi:DNA-binding MarR family transcriptional regulator
MKKNSRASGGPSPQAMQSWLAVVRSYHLCEAVLTQRLSALGLKLAEHEVLVNLVRSPGSTQQGLAQRCFVAKSGVSMLVSRMVQAGLVLRRPDEVDARAWRLSLTAKGERLARQAVAVQAEVVEAMTQGSSEAELQAIGEAMVRAGDVLQGLLSSRA